MNAGQRRQYEMLLRLRDFSNTHRDLFAASAVAQEAFASVDAAITELTTTDQVKLSASAAARNDRKALARKALTELLVKVCTLARVLRARGVDVADFEMPVSKSDQTLLTAARQFAQDAVPLEAEFNGHGIGPKVIAEGTAAFDKATRDKGMKRADHTAARTRIQDLLASAFLDVRRLDLIVDNELGDNNPLRAVWKEARRVLSARASRGSAATPNEAPAPTPAPSAEAPVPSAVEDAPKSATVIPMPVREAA